MYKNTGCFSCTCTFRLEVTPDVCDSDHRTLHVHPTNAQSREHTSERKITDQQDWGKRRFTETKTEWSLCFFWKNSSQWNNFHNRSLLNPTTLQRHNCTHTCPHTHRSLTLSHSKVSQQTFHHWTEAQHLQLSTRVSYSWGLIWINVSSVQWCHCWHPPHTDTHTHTKDQTDSWAWNDINLHTRAFLCRPLGLSLKTNLACIRQILKTGKRLASFWASNVLLAWFLVFSNQQHKSSLTLKLEKLVPSYCNVVITTT